MTNQNEMKSDSMHKLDPLADAVIEKAIDNVTKKVIGGFRNKDNSQPSKKHPSIKTITKDTIEATSASSVMEVANRGGAWKEMIQKSLSHGISSLSTLQFDGEFKVKGNVAEGLDNLPDKPGVYVVYDKSNVPVYVGDSGKMKTRWYAGHLNENKQAKESGAEYKLSPEFEEGCIVKFIVCDSVETAAAIEAHLIKEGHPRVNTKEELKENQGTRSNQEAKKMKDSSSSTANLVKGAAIEGAKNVGWTVAEELITTAIKVVKDELVDILAGKACALLKRVERVIEKIWVAIKRIINQPLSILKGLFEFVVNALSESLRKIYNLAKNIYELGMSAWNLYKGSKTMNRIELANKISETLIIGGSLILWDAFDAMIESNLTAMFPMLGPISPVISAILAAIGFGLTSHYLCQFIPKVVEMILNFETSYHRSHAAQVAAVEQLVKNAEMNEIMLNSLNDYVKSSAELCREIMALTQQLTAPAYVVEKRELLSDVRLLLGD